MTQLDDSELYPVVAIRKHYYQMVGGEPVLLSPGTAFMTVRLSQDRATYPAYGEWRECLSSRTTNSDWFESLLAGCSETVVPRDVGLKLLLQHQLFCGLPAWVQELAVAYSS